MELVNIRDIFRDKEKYIGNQITVGGWVRSIRDSKTFGFMIVNDGTFFENLQIVFDDTLDNFEMLSKLNVGSRVKLSWKSLTNRHNKAYDVPRIDTEEYGL